MKARTFWVLMIAPALIAAGEAETTPDAKDGDQLVCKYQTNTGTRFRKRVCRTKREIDQMSERDKREAAEVMNRSPQNPVGD